MRKTTKREANWRPAFFFFRYSKVMVTPTFEYETRFWREGVSVIAGIDEVGMGAWAGPVVAGAVVFPPLKGGEGGLRHLPFDKKFVHQARELRKNMTYAEQMIWQRILRKRQLAGYKFLRQKPILHYVADFWCAEIQLVIEIDGDSHDEQTKDDNERTQNLGELGIAVARYTNQDIMNNLDGVYQDLQRRIKARERTHPNPPFKGRGTVIRDSKTMSARQREAAEVWILENAWSWAVGEASVEEIAELNIRGAAQLAMRRAVNALKIKPDLLLIDGTEAQPHELIPAKCIVDGDATCFSIAAASILAKNYRDAIMIKLDVEYPGYGLARHKGYGSREHLLCLARLGPVACHRPSYAPIARLLEAE